MPRHIIIILLKTKDKENTLKAAREKPCMIDRGTPIQKATNFSPETKEARRSSTPPFKKEKKENYYKLKIPNLMKLYRELRGN